MSAATCRCSPGWSRPSPGTGQGRWPRVTRALVPTNPTATTNALREQSVRMSNADLRARRMFQYERESIEAHLTIAFAPFAVARYLQQQGVRNPRLQQL